MRRWRPARIANTVSVSATRTERPLSTRRPKPLPPRKRPPPGAPCLRIWTATIRAARSDGPRIPGDHDASAPTPRPRSRAQKGQPEPPQNVAEKRSDFWNNFQKKRDGESKGKGGIAARHACRRHRRPVGRAQALQPLHGPLPDHPAGDVQRAPLLRRPARHQRQTDPPRSCSTSSSACSRPSSSACGTS